MSKNIYIFSLKIIISMIIESYVKTRETETGGILIGPSKNCKLVTNIVNSTSHAIRTYTRYIQPKEDVNYLNNQLGQYHKHDKVFLGYWHKHPPKCRFLSSDDLDTCHSVLINPNYKINNRLLMLIVSEDADTFPVHSYMVSLDESGDVVCENIDVRILPAGVIKRYMECL